MRFDQGNKNLSGHDLVPFKREALTADLLTFACVLSIGEGNLFHRGSTVHFMGRGFAYTTLRTNQGALRGKVALVCSVYSAVGNGAVSVASLKPKMRMEYGNQVVECAFEFKGGFFSSMIYTYVIGQIEIDQDHIVLSPSGATSKTGSEATPWLTRKGEKLQLTMDGPHVFKGHPLERSGKKQYV